MTVSLASDGSVRVVTLARPEAANALSVAMLTALGATLETLRADDEARAVIITAAGKKAFCAGADLKERAGMSPDEVLSAVTTIRQTISAIAALPMPVIAAINGVALGGGTEVALACDIRIAARSASFGLTETTLAIIPGGGGTQRLARLVGPGRAKELIFTGRRVNADEALAIGLVEELCEPDSLLARAKELAERIADNGPVAVRAAKEAIDRGASLPLAQALELETELYTRTIATEDRTEGLTAFREKRAPTYRGR